MHCREGYENLSGPQRFHSICSIQSTPISETAISSIIRILDKREGGNKKAWQGSVLRSKKRLTMVALFFVFFNTLYLKSSCLCNFHWFLNRPP